MKIWFDIGHIAQFNFYKQFILQCVQAKHDVYVTVLGRGKLPKIAQKELGVVENLNIDVIGRHRMTRLSVVFEANLLRSIQLLKWAYGKSIDVTFSNGYLGAFVSKIKGIPVYTFDDDPQTYNYYLKLLFSDKAHSCLYEKPKNIKLSNKVIIVKALKEWAYLNPNVYKADVGVLDEYGMLPYHYIFIREVSVGTFNYANQNPNSITSIIKYIPANIPVLFSLEDKTQRDLYPENWILLQEPLKDVHSLIYYSCGLISSGDSMAREAALLGVPAYYIGVRYDMPANLIAAKMASFDNQKTSDINLWIQTVSKKKDEASNQQQKRIKSISQQFVDINEYFNSLLYSNNSVI